MKLDGGMAEQKSYMGASLTLILFLATLIFAYTRIISMVNKDMVDVLSYETENAIDFKEKFTGK